MRSAYLHVEHMSTDGVQMSQQNENVRFVQSRNVRFHPGREEGWDRLSAKERERLKVLQQVEEGHHIEGGRRTTRFLSTRIANSQH